jgi:hypothetical protein
MKFSLARGVLALALPLTLASCGGGGKATYPIHVTVFGLVYSNLTLSTNGMNVTVEPAGTADSPQPVSVYFPNGVEYGELYNVIPSKQPPHQTCQVPVQYPYNLLPSGTGGQLAKIEIYYSCAVNTFTLGGSILNLKGTGLVLTNGSESTYAATPTLDTANMPTGAKIDFSMNPVPYGKTFGVTVLTQPQGQTCTVQNGVGEMNDAAENVNGVTNLIVNCVDKPAS